MKFPIILALSAFTLIGCSSSKSNNNNNNPTPVVPTPSTDKQSAQISKSKYDEMINKDNVLLHSNYTFTLYNAGALYMITDLDNGKVHNRIPANGFERYFKIINYGEESDLYIYSAFKELEDTRTVSKSYLYSYFFYGFEWLFDISYETWTFNETSLTYTCQNVTVGYQTITSGSLKVENNLPSEMNLTFSDGGGMYKFTFTNHGFVNIDL